MRSINVLLLSASLIVAMFFFSGCVCIVRALDNERAQENAALMESVVQVEKKVTVEVTNTDGTTVTLHIGGRGSGTVVAGNVDKEETLVLTAGHVCEAPAVGAEADLPIGHVKVTEVSIDVITLRGSKLDAEAIVQSMIPDVCVVKVHGIAGKVAKVANELPPVGSVVVNVGYPLGVKSNMYASITQGFYSGLHQLEMKEGKFVTFVMSTVQITHGNSGSALFFEGKIIGVVVMGPESYNSMAISTNLDDVKEAIQQALRVW